MELSYITFTWSGGSGGALPGAACREKAAMQGDKAMWRWKLNYVHKDTELWGFGIKCFSNKH